MMRKLFFLIFINFCALISFGYAQDSGANQAAISNNRQFRQAIMHEVRAIAQNLQSSNPYYNPSTALIALDNLYKNNAWTITVTSFKDGQLYGQGFFTDKQLAAALYNAVEMSFKNASIGLMSDDDLNHLTFEVDFSYPPNRYYSIIEYKHDGLELLGNRVALRYLTRPMLENQLLLSQNYLLSIMNPKWHGFFKTYDPDNDGGSIWLRTVYSASSLYTFLKLDHYQPNPSLKKHFKAIAQFLLSMQIQEGENQGAFYYALSSIDGKKACHVVVGTTAKTIFTLLKMHELYPHEHYLAAASQGGDWLTQQVKDDGRIITSGSCKNGVWRYSERQSFLYSGQVLSALSRLYAVTRKDSYYQAATRIAKRMQLEMIKQNNLVGDDFRAPNSISTSWVLMSLMDYSKLNKNASRYLHLVNQAGQKILTRQITNTADVYDYGRYFDTMSTSGNGWINEVFSEYYPFCEAQHLPHCDAYKQAMLATTRWLMQNVYSQENTYLIPNPPHALGGFIRSYTDQNIRTDSVCHGLNSIINLLAFLPKEHHLLIALPEPDFDEMIGLLRIGQIQQFAKASTMRQENYAHNG